MFPHNLNRIVSIEPPYIHPTVCVRLHNGVCVCVWVEGVQCCYREGLWIAPLGTGDDVSPQEFFFRASVSLIGLHKATQLPAFRMKNMWTFFGSNRLGECARMISATNFRSATIEISNMEHNISRKITSSFFFKPLKWTVYRLFAWGCCVLYGHEKLVPPTATNVVDVARHPAARESHFR